MLINTVTNLNRQWAFFIAGMEVSDNEVFILMSEYEDWLNAEEKPIHYLDIHEF